MRLLQRFFFLYILFWLFSFCAHAQVTQEVFGKNRVQYKPYNWRMITSKNFEVYYYDYGSKLANYAIRFGEAEFSRITDVVGYTPSSKTKLFIYNSITDLQQSNIGLDNENAQVSGQANFIKSKIEVPFEGSLVDFEKEVSYGIAQIFVTEMMFGGTVREMLQNSVLLSLPEWFITGAAAYVAEGWSLEMDNYLRDAIQNKKIKKLSLLEGEEAKLVGQSFWNYIAEKYGKANISSILNLTRITRNEETSIEGTLGIRYKSLVTAWQAFYKKMADEVIINNPVAPYDKRFRKNNRKGYLYNQVKISNDGRYVAYSENYKGKYKVIVRNTLKNRKKTVLRKGFRLLTQRVATNVPLMAWQGNNLVMMYMQKGKPYIIITDAKGKLKYKKHWTFFNQIVDFDVSEDGRYLVISADRRGVSDIRSGQNDLFIYDLQDQVLKQITEDLYDELNPVFIGNSNQKFAFSSNRVSDTISVPFKERGDYRTIQDNYDLFIYDSIQSTKAFQRIVVDPGNQIKPTNSPTDSTKIYYLSDENGILNLNKYDLNTQQTNHLTNYRQNIETYDINPLYKQFAFLTLSKRRKHLNFKRNLNLDTNLIDIPTYRSEILAKRENRQKIVRTPQPIDSVKADTIPYQFNPDFIDTDNYTFDPEVLKEFQKQNTTIKQVQNQFFNTTKSPNDSLKLNIKGSYDYFPLMGIANIVTTPVIDPLRGFGIMFTAAVSDVLENHKFKGGALVITDLRNSSFFGEYQYLAKRLDYNVRFDKKTLFLNNESVLHRYGLNKYQLLAAYPFTNTSRISFSPHFMSTHYTNLNPGLLAIPDTSINYVGGKIEYVFDNTLTNGMNMLTGTRIKIRYETNFGLKGNSYSFNNLSVDIRNYKKIHREIILATRLAYGQFGGQSPKKYLLGGMDNWLFNRTDPGKAGSPLNTTPELSNFDLLFVEYATNLRGFNYNKLYGTKYLLFNAEVRVPLVKYLYRGFISSNFFKNLQFTGFLDVGTAWSGTGPFKRSNSLNTQDIKSGPFSGTVNNFKNPFLTGYGAGLRTLLLGYYIKVDAAWALEDYIPSKTPKLYVTLGYDF